MIQVTLSCRKLRYTQVKQLKPEERGQKQEQDTFPVSHNKPTAASELPLLFRAKQIFFFLFATRQHLVHYAFMLLCIRKLSHLEII